MKSLLKIISLVLIPFLIGIAMPEKDLPVLVEGDHLNPGHLDGAFTGGFGEQSCHSCHFDYDLNREEGQLTLNGIGKRYQPGEKYQFIVTIESEHLEIGGFQMTARFEDGTQAGTFRWDTDRLMLTPSISDQVQYLQHSETGTQPTDERRVSWTFNWIAPETEDESVIVNIAANAGNYDDSAFGDWIYLKEVVLKREE